MPALGGLHRRVSAPGGCLVQGGSWWRPPRRLLVCILVYLKYYNLPTFPFHCHDTVVEISTVLKSWMTLSGKMGSQVNNSFNRKCWVGFTSEVPHVTSLWLPRESVHNRYVLSHRYANQCARSKWDFGTLKNRKCKLSAPLPMLCPSLNYHSNHVWWW